MKEYTITRCQGAPDWSNIPAVQINELHQTPEVDIRAWAQVCYDDTALHVRLEAEEKNVLATYTGLLDPVCEDSCLEFFLSPIAGDKRYFNIEVNPNGAIYLGFGSGIADLVRLIAQESPIIEPVVTRTEKGWNVTYSIPFQFIKLFFPNFEAKKGAVMRGNFYKCGEETDPMHFMCWCPVVPQRCAFHNPDRFGTLYFG